MQRLTEEMQIKARGILIRGLAKRVLAWKAGEFFYDNAPAAFDNLDSCDNIVYNEFCPGNLAKYLMNSTRAGIKTAAFLKPCDTYGVNQLIKDNRVKRELVYVVGTPCSGMIDAKKIKAAGYKTLLKVECEGEKIFVTTPKGTTELAKKDFLYDKCRMCKGNDYMICDEELEEKLPTPEPIADPLAEVKAIEAMTPAEKFAFWQEELSKCIRCNTCRDVCPACNCEQCIFDNPEAPVAGKAYADSVEEQLFHIIRAFHVAGRCVGCGECERVCPQGVKLGLLNMKFAKDINSFYGKFQAGVDAKTLAPQVSYEEDDPEPNEAVEGGSKNA